MGRSLYPARRIVRGDRRPSGASGDGSPFNDADREVLRLGSTGDSSDPGFLYPYIYRPTGRAYPGNEFGTQRVNG